uniref:Uncharacterized protein n=1 Tax=Anguilla anguilla TaxID=7936 RepID=A0A0E9XF57_ANGAN
MQNQNTFTFIFLFSKSTMFKVFKDRWGPLAETRDSGPS